jgi:hypothetical protein
VLHGALDFRFALRRGRRRAECHLRKPDDREEGDEARRFMPRAP